MRKLGSDAVIGCGLLAFSAFAAWRSLRIGGQSVGTIAGPSFLPWLMIAAIVLLSIALLMRARRAAVAASPEVGPVTTKQEDDAALGKRNLWRIWIFAAMLVAYSAAFMPVGYLPATYAVFVIGMLLMGERKPLMFLILPAIITGAVWFGFTHFLQVWLP